MYVKQNNRIENRVEKKRIKYNKIYGKRENTLAQNKSIKSKFHNYLYIKSYNLFPDKKIVYVR